MGSVDIANIISKSESLSPQALCELLIENVKEIVQEKIKAKEIDKEIEKEKLQEKKWDDTTILVTKFTKTATVEIRLSELTRDSTPTISYSSTSSSNPSISPMTSILRTDTPVIEYSDD